ncbi:MAG: hypothetical protein DLM62_10070 [Pseudonocardiales bacterium]|nr:MAG: hypothetical protein DLM62_10070 [Pseudonocardiales bacterium]
MPTIEVSDTVYQALKERAIPFEDTPNSVLERLLNDPGEQRGDGAARIPPPGRAAVGTLLPEGDYQLPILRALIEAGGRAPAGQVTDRVGELLEGQLTERDHDCLRSGDIRWRIRTAFARLTLVRRELLADGSPRGIWEITQQGREHARPS